MLLGGDFNADLDDSPTALQMIVRTITRSLAVLTGQPAALSLIICCFLLRYGPLCWVAMSRRLRHSPHTDRFRWGQSTSFTVQPHAASEVYMDQCEYKETYAVPGQLRFVQELEKAVSRRSSTCSSRRVPQRRARTQGFRASSPLSSRRSIRKSSAL